MLDKSSQAGKHAFAVRGVDLYSTAPEATRALLKVERLPPWIWEPAAGRGAIVEVLTKAGHSVTATDLIDHGHPDVIPGRDFLLERRAPWCCDCIVTNPPYRLANQFVARALKLVPRVYMLLRLAFLESSGRTAILEGAGLARVHVFRNRLPMMHRDGWHGPKASSATAFAWFCWDHEHKGLPTLHRISWEAAE